MFHNLISKAKDYKMPILATVIVVLVVGLFLALIVTYEPPLPPPEPETLEFSGRVSAVSVRTSSSQGAEYLVTVNVTDSIVWHNNSVHYNGTNGSFGQPHMVVTFHDLPSDLRINSTVWIRLKVRGTAETVAEYEITNDLDADDTGPLIIKDGGSRFGSLSSDLMFIVPLFTGLFGVLVGYTFGVIFVGSTGRRPR